ncbi:MAG: hypothetical protein J6A92_02220 [Lachnospiraceae bacterium]|nr:hypothetical protein [Lachnospiraceae bacterium]
MTPELSWTGLTDSGDSTIQVEKGQQFYIGDYGRIYDFKKGYRLASEFKVIYTSSKEAVAEINEKGLFTAKSTGTTRVTMKYKGAKCACRIEVVEEGAFGTSEIIEKARKEVDWLSRIIPQRVTVKNGVLLLQVALRYENIISKECYLEINHFGFLMEETESCKLAIPQAGRYEHLNSLLARYKEKYLAYFQIKSILVSTKEIDIRLKEEITAKQMLAAQIVQCQMYSMYAPLQKEQATLHLHIEDEETEETVVCLGKIEKGSKNIIAIPVEFSYGEEITYTKLELKKGHTYCLGDKMQWSKGRRFTVE